MVRRLLFTLFLFLLFLTEGTLFQWLTPDTWGADWIVIPLLSLMVIIMVAIYFGPTYGVMWGGVFGLMYDVTFGHMIGAYMFSYMIVTYFSGQISRQYQPHHLLTILCVLLGIVGHIMMIYGLYRLFDVTQMSVQWMFYKLLLPSGIINGVVAILLLRPMKRWFRVMGAHMEGNGAY